METNPKTFSHNQSVCRPTGQECRYKLALWKATGLALSQISNDKTVKLVKFTQNKNKMNELKKRLGRFYGRDYVSRVMQGKNDATKSDGELQQTRLLNDYLSCLHEMFLSENQDMKCSY